MAEFLVGVVTGLSLAGLAWILAPPSRRARAEGRLDRDTETRILLGLDPEPTPELGSGPGSRPGPEFAEPDHPRRYDTSELQALRRLGQGRRSRN